MTAAAMTSGRTQPRDRAGRARRWVPAAPLRTARVGAGVEALGGWLYVVGGKDASGNKLRSVEVGRH